MFTLTSFGLLNHRTPENIPPAVTPARGRRPVVYRGCNGPRSALARRACGLAEWTSTVRCGDGGGGGLT
ncbi:hypothetical protein GCM10023220_46160 [Streptomyces ziwulingensis]|uniref:Uncharacterized protein n=1 Tax=Streptomyces ziwulingensis TaxID=1045501 RepID=A0ABP9CG98_9ACTN